MSELRLVLTNVCNFKCFFCHGEGSKTRVENMLNADDYTFLFLQSTKILDTTKVSLTGGEPMVRRDIIDIVKQLYNVGAKITMTSNFSNISKYMDVGKYVSKMNVSFHAFDDEALRDIIGVQVRVHDLIDDIRDFAYKYPEVKLCLNCTVNTKNCDEGNLLRIIKFANEINANVNFSELYCDNVNEIVNLDWFGERLIHEGFSPEGLLYGRSQKYVREEQMVKLSKILCVAAKESVAPKEYCKEHRDLFIMPDGKIDICREKEVSVDILDAIKTRDSVGVLHGIIDAINLMGSGCE